MNLKINFNALFFNFIHSGNFYVFRNIYFWIIVSFVIRGQRSLLTLKKKSNVLSVKQCSSCDEQT